MNKNNKFLKLVKQKNIIEKKLDKLKNSFRENGEDSLVKVINLVEKKVNLYNGLKYLNRYENEINVLNSCVELLSHELMLALKKNQLIHNTSPNIQQISNSQLGQDLWVLNKTNFKKMGYFVEVGASDGIKLSNTYVLETSYGWTGLCIEPDLSAYENLVKNRKCKCSNDLIGKLTGENFEFVHANSFGGILDFACADNHSEKRISFKKIGRTSQLTTISLDDELSKYNSPNTIDYMSIDTEGSEYYILQNFDFSKWDIKLLTIEHNYSKNRYLIHDLMKSNGYDFIEVEWDDWYFKD